MFDGEEAVLYRIDFEQGQPALYTPFNDIDVDDQCVSVALYGFTPRDYWAKAIGVSEEGFTTYKLLPMDRA